MERGWISSKRGQGSSEIQVRYREERADLFFQHQGFRNEMGLEEEEKNSVQILLCYIVGIFSANN